MQSEQERTPTQHVDPALRDDARDLARDAITGEELDQEQATDLPDRDAMSLVNLNAAVPINAAIAANVLSDNSTAFAGAVQNTPIDQKQ
jgi:hypothetical protein